MRKNLGVGWGVDLGVRVSMMFRSLWEYGLSHILALLICSDPRVRVKGVDDVQVFEKVRVKSYISEANVF